MAIISSFLCWSNTRTGSAVCGYYTLVISVVCLAFYMLRYIALDEMDSIELKGIVYAGFVLYSFLIGVSLILLPGVYMDRKFFLLPWIYVLVITVLYETGAIALITTVHLEQDHTLHTWEIVAVVFYCLRLVANCYCFACVVSQYQELSEGRGTYEFLFKPRRRHTNRGAPMTDIDEYHTPYGVTLPPYSEDNPYKQFSPPNYENLAVDIGDLDSPHRRRCGSHRRSQGFSGAASSSCLAEVVVNPCPSGMQDIEIDDDGEGYLDHFHHQAILYPDHQRQLSTCLCDVQPHDTHLHFHPNFVVGGGSRGGDESRSEGHHSRVPSYLSESSGVRCQTPLDWSPGIKRNGGVGLHSRQASQGSHLSSFIIGEELSAIDGDDDSEERHSNVAMTESSGSFLNPSPSPPSSRSCSSSPALLHIHIRGQRSLPAIQKRTYITWI